MPAGSGVDVEESNPGPSLSSYLALLCSVYDIYSFEIGPFYFDGGLVMCSTF